MLGFDVGSPRPPMPGLDDAQRADLRSALLVLDMIPAARS